MNYDFAKFTDVTVDGTKVDKANYTAVSGSTVVTFTEAFMNTLAAGNHNVQFQYNDGTTVDYAFTVSEAPAKSGNPTTGDATNIGIISAVFAGALGTAGTVFVVRKRKNNN